MQRTGNAYQILNSYVFPTLLQGLIGEMVDGGTPILKLTNSLFQRLHPPQKNNLLSVLSVRWMSIINIWGTPKITPKSALMIAI